MIEQIPWPAFSVASGGWVLFGLLAWRVLRSVTNGDLVTRRESDAKDEALKLERQRSEELLKQNNLLLESALPTVNAFFSALHEAADLREPT